MKESLDFSEHEEGAGTVITITLPEDSAVDESQAREAFRELIEDGGGDGDPQDRNGEGEDEKQRRHERGYQA